MILRAYLNGEVPDIQFVPVNISYDRVMEEKLFAYELLGVPKPKESTSVHVYCHDKSQNIYNQISGIFQIFSVDEGKFWQCLC